MGLWVLWAHLLFLGPLHLVLFPIKPKDLRYPFDGFMGLVSLFVVKPLHYTLFCDKSHCIWAPMS